MVFSSMTFLCLFLPLVFFLHTVAKSTRLRNIILLAFSLLFYAWGEPIWIAAMLFATAVNYLCALFIHRQKDAKKRKLALAAGLVISLSFLFYLKYAAFLVNSFAGLFSLPFSVTAPKMPIGISFFTFQIITYTVDVYRGDAPLQKNPLDLLLYVCLFPQLIAGPIVRYGDVAAQIDTRKVTASGVGNGFFRFTLGLGKKVILANLCGEALNGLPATADMTMASAWLSALLFSLQLYFDFAGYSDMAIGMGRMFGFTFLENFDAPYCSRSISEYWRRWHISLGSFFREYVYIPLGGNRVSRGRWVFNMLVVWILTGFWHGASWNYLLWGLYYGILILLERTVFKTLAESLPRVLQHVLTLVLVIVGVVMFHNEDFTQMGQQLEAMFLPWVRGLSDPQAVYVWKDNLVLLLISCICCLPLRKKAEAFWKKRRTHGKKTALRPYLKAAVSVSLLVLSLLFLVGQSYNPFLYFRF